MHFKPDGGKGDGLLLYSCGKVRAGVCSCLRGAIADGICFPGEAGAETDERQKTAVKRGGAGNEKYEENTICMDAVDMDAGAVCLQRGRAVGTG